MKGKYNISNLLDAGKLVLRGKFIAVNVIYLRRKVSNQ